VGGSLAEKLVVPEADAAPAAQLRRIDGRGHVGGGPDAIEAGIAETHFTGQETGEVRVAQSAGAPDVSLRELRAALLGLCFGIMMLAALHIVGGPCGC
jgi:hypothetical protein